MRTLFAFTVAGLAACSAGAPGVTVSCDYGDADYCTQTISSSGHSTSALQKDCTDAGGTATPACSAGSLVGTCADADFGDTTQSLYYYTPTFDATSAKADCATRNGTYTSRS